MWQWFCLSLIFFNCRYIYRITAGHGIQYVWWIMWHALAWFINAFWQVYVWQHSSVVEKLNCLQKVYLGLDSWI